MNPRFVVGLDLDGVVFNIVDGYRRLFAEILGVDRSVFGPVTDYYFNCWAPIVRDSAHYRELHLEAVARGLFARLDPYPGAVEAVSRLHENGAYIRIITHRAGGPMTEILHQTAASLNEIGLPFDAICFDGEKTSIAADLYVDDAPHNLVAYADAGLPAIVFAQRSDPYNVGCPGIRAWGWCEAEQLIVEAMSALAVR